MSAVALSFYEGKKAILTRAMATITAMRALRAGQTKRFTASSMMTTGSEPGREPAFLINTGRDYGRDTRLTSS